MATKEQAYMKAFTELLEGKDELIKDAFHQFLKEKLCEENIEFYWDFKKFKDLKDGTTEQKDKARSMWDKYFATEAPVPLNVDHTNVKQLEEAIVITGQVTSTLFDEISFFVTKLLKEDGFRKFYLSSQYQAAQTKSNKEKQRMAALACIFDAVMHGDTARVKQTMKQYGSLDMLNLKESRHQQTAVHVVASRGDLPTLKLFLKKKCDLTQKDKNGWTPLHCAANAGNLKACEMILQHKSNGVKLMTDDGMTALHFLARLLIANEEASLYNSVLKLVVDKGVDVNAQDKGGDSALHLAAVIGNEIAVHFLVKQKATINIRNKSNSTPIHYAAGTGKLNVIKFLAESGADLSIRSDMDGTALDISKRMCHLMLASYLSEKMGCVAVSDPRRVRKNAVEDEEGKTIMKEEIVSLVLGSEGDEELLIHAAIQRNNYPFAKQLLSTQSNINVLDKNGMSPILIAAREGYLRIMDLLLNAKADPAYETSEGQTALHLLAKAYPLAESDSTTPLSSIFKQLIDKVEVNYPDKNGQGPLHLAAGCGNEEFVQLLLKHKANINLADVTGLTPLHHAAGSGKMNVVKLLVDAGADQSLKSKTEGTAIDYAKKKCQLMVVSYLTSESSKKKEKGSDPQSEQTILIAASEDNNDLVRFLLKKGTSLRAIDQQNGYTPLHYAASSGNLGICDSMLQAGGGMDLRSISTKGETALHLLFSALTSRKTSSLDNAFFSTVKMFLEKGADVNQEDEAGDTVVHYAVKLGSEKALSLILKAKGNPNIANNKGNTPLHLCVEGEQAHLILLLLDHGADANAINKEGSTPLSIAKSIPNGDILRLLTKDDKK